MKIKNVWFDDRFIFVEVSSGHVVGNPLKWYIRLNKATPEQREQYEIGPDGESLHWENIDADLSLEGFFDFKRELDYAKI